MVLPLLSLLLIMLLCWFVGSVVLRLFAQPVAETRLETTLATLAAGITVTGLVALLLAETGWFSIGRLCLALALISATILLKTGLPAPHTLLPPRPPANTESALLALWLLIAGWLFLRPHEFIIGGADAGVYVNLAASINTHGSIVFRDETLAQLDPALYPVLLRTLPPHEPAPWYLLPAFFVPGDTPGEIVPQFYPLHPVWQAVAWGMGGTRATLLLNGVWALLASLTLYTLVRRLAGQPVALLALTALSLNALQVWFARYPTTEILTQYLLWTGLWALVVWIEKPQRPDPFWGLLAGLMPGLVMLTRIDTYFLLGIPLVLAFWLLWIGRLRRTHAWFFLPIVLLAAWSVLHALTQSAPYFHAIFGHALRTLRTIWWLPALIVAGGSAAAIWLLRWRERAARLAPWLPWLQGGLAAGLLLLAAWGWFVRPFPATEAATWLDWYGGQPLTNYDHENLRRLGWYLSSVGVWLGVIGAAWWIYRPKRATTLLLAVGLFFSLLYLWRIQANPHQIYAMRRHVPVTLPFFVSSAALFCGTLWATPRRWQQGLGVLLALLWLGGNAWSARGFVSQIDYSGLIDQVAALDRQLDPGSVLIFDDQSPVGQGDVLGTPLRFLHGHTVFTFRDPDTVEGRRLIEAVAGWQAGGRSVYWIGPPEWPDAFGLPYTTTVVTISTAALEGTYDRKPVQILPFVSELKLHRLEPVRNP